MAARQPLEENESKSAEKSKAIRLIDYLTRLASLRAAVIRDIEEYHTVLWLKDIPRQKGCFTQAWGRDEDFDSEVWIEVQTRREPELPSVPALCKDWIEKPSLRNKSDLPQLISQIKKQVKNPDWQEGSHQPEFITFTEHLGEHPEVQEAWDEYVEKCWLPWVEAHNVWEEIYKVYSMLFAIHQEQRRLGEEYEFVLGLGLLVWKTPTGQCIRRHLIVANALLEFEAHLGKFIVRPMADGARVRPELDMLDIEDQPACAEERVKSSLADADDDPWEKSCIEGVLQALARSINAQGEYDSALEAKNAPATDKPIVEYAPALILRKRSAKGLTETLERIREKIEKGEWIPNEFGDLAEIGLKNNADLENEPSEANNCFGGEVFFPKPSNEAQRRIVEKIRAAKGVLVQGPPGTGKSHTIANLICHLLATGQRTLITAKIPRALQVLEGQLPDELRPLCVNLLGSGLEEKQSLEASVSGILRKSGEWNKEQAVGECKELEQKLRQLREEKARVDRRLRDTRESETHSQSIAEGTYQGTAARIAKAVNRDRSRYEWFTDIVPLNSACPISKSDLQDVLAALRRFTPEKRQELNLTWLDALPLPEHLTRLIKDEKKAVEQKNESAIGADESIVKQLSNTEAASIDGIREVFSAFHMKHRQLLALNQPWMPNALHDITGGNSFLWRELFRVTRETVDSIEKLAPLADDTHVDFPGGTPIRRLFDEAYNLIEHLEKGGTIGWGPFRHKLVKEHIHILKTVRVNGRLCSDLGPLSMLVDILWVQIQCEKAWGFWVGHHEPTQGPYALQLQMLKALCDALDSALSLEGLVEKCREALQQCTSLGEPSWIDKSQIERLIASCQLALASHAERLVVREIGSIEDLIISLAVQSNVHPIMSELLQAIRNRDIVRYAHGVNKIQNLEIERQSVQETDKSIEKLRSLAPRLMDELERTYRDSCWETHVEEIRAAWHWAQARFWIEEYISADDVSSLERRTHQIDDEINEAIARLASLHAWSFCFSRLQESHRRHMVAWQQSIGRIGKGTGKYVHRYRREAQQHLNACCEAVPAWIMPLHRVWDTVDPASEIFDVVIVDEASQCGFEALPLFYLGKKILIVGDDRQISPEAVGDDRASVHQLMDLYLYDFKHRDLFDIDCSLFNHGKRLTGPRLHYVSTSAACRRSFASVTTFAIPTRR